MRGTKGELKNRPVVRAAALLAMALLLVATGAAEAATLSPALQTKLPSLADSVTVDGLVIVSFSKAAGATLDASRLALLQQLGITGGYVLPNLGMVAVRANAGQLRALAARPEVRSLWSNDQLYYYLHEARMLAGVDRVPVDAGFTRTNGGMPISGAGDFSVVVNDSGIDATHPDLPMGSKVIQNVQILSDTELLSGFTPLVFVENVSDTDALGGHGTHVAGIVGGLGSASGGLYAGVAPGVRLVGCGSGVTLVVLNALGGFEYALSKQYIYRVRVITNSWGSSGAFDPEDPINIATKEATDRNIVVLFAAGNSGPGWNTINPYAKAPWVISVGAGTKEGGIASFSSRGTPKEDRLADADPNNDYDAPTVVAPGTGREFDLNAQKFTAAIVSTRTITNLVANGLTDDTEIPPAYLPYYTQISGTSMATPFAAGVVALMLDADPTLTPAEVRAILQATATPMPGYDEFQVGSGYINAYAAVDNVLHGAKAYGSYLSPSFNVPLTFTWGSPTSFVVDYTPQQPGPTSTNTHSFSVPEGMGWLYVAIDFGTTVVTDELGNSMGLQLYAPDGRTYSSGLTLPVLDSPSRMVAVKYPLAGEWVAEVRGLRGLAAVPVSSPVGIAVPEQVNGIVKMATVTLGAVPDIAGHVAEAEITRALLNRQMDVLGDGLFHPDANVTRGDFAQALAFDTPLRQSLAGSPPFTDVPVGLAAIAEAVTTKGSTLRDWNFNPSGMMSATAPLFRPGDLLHRIDTAVALVRALGLDAEARALAGSTVTVTYSGQTLALTDNADIPAALRGYVQLALDRQILQAFFTLEQGPFDFFPTLKARVKPNDPLSRAFLAFAFDHFRQHFEIGN